MKTKDKTTAREGAILGVILIILVLTSILVLSLFHMAAHAGREAEYELKSAQAFWLAEAGRQWCIADLYAGGGGVIAPQPGASIVGGTFEVVEEPDPDPNDGLRTFISEGVVIRGGQTATRRIRMVAVFASGLFEKAVHGGGERDSDWTFQLRGTGDDTPPAPSYSGSIWGGKDSVLGDVAINGDVLLAEDSFIGVPTPNNYNVNGDLDAAGIISMIGDPVSGYEHSGASADIDPAPDLAVMDYANNNDYDIAQIFNDAGVSSGRLPSDHPLSDVLNVTKNPADRAADNALTAGDDFYFEPASVGSAGTPATAVTPLGLGDDKIYYVDGHVWFHNRDTYGFEVDGQAAIISSRDIHICDNLEYENRGGSGVGGDMPDLLVLVALGQYDSISETYLSDGNVFFGDPRYGTTYSVDAFMFANNDFLYMTSAIDPLDQKQPTSGFKVFGNFMAVNRVVVLRDWYEQDSSGKYRAAEYDPATGEWLDAVDLQNGTRTLLSSGEIDSLRHYAMQVGYDDRIRDAATQMRGLPLGNGFFAGERSWEEI